MAKKFEYQFEWDTAKARQNLKEHRISFERAATTFLDPSALSEVDEEHSDEEQRWLTLALDHTGELLVVSHTYRDETEAAARIRLISARRATKNEAKQYERK
ncbi:MAG: BrnT family toxin [Acidobacteriota bacterium]